MSTVEEQPSLKWSDVAGIAGGGSAVIGLITALAVTGAVQQMQRDHGLLLIVAVLLGLLAAACWLAGSLVKQVVKTPENKQLLDEHATTARWLRADFATDSERRALCVATRCGHLGRCPPCLPEHHLHRLCARFHSPPERHELLAGVNASSSASYTARDSNSRSMIAIRSPATVPQRTPGFTPSFHPLLHLPEQ